MALLSALAMEIAIPACTVIGITFFLVQWWFRCCTTAERNDEERSLTSFDGNCDQIRNDVSKGVRSFLLTEYRVYVQVFAVASAIILFLFLGSVESFSTRSQPCTLKSSHTCKPALATAIFSALSFLLAAFTSILSGFLGTKFVIDTSKRTALEEKNGVRGAFHAVFRSGAAMGFLHAAMGLLVLYLSINLFKLYYGNDWEGLFEAVTGYGLGASSMALFARTAGAIYAKAADVCVHLVKRIEDPIPERRNPAVIPNYVGDVVGDIAGLGTDLFCSYAESSCVALVVAAISSFGFDHDFTAMCYPLLISSMGILVCFITTLLTASFFRINEARKIKLALRSQLIFSTSLMTVGIAIVSWIALPSTFTIYNFGSQKVVTNWQPAFCAAVGLWARLIIGPLQDLPAERFGLASVSIPFVAGISIFTSYSFAATYGLAVAALGISSPIPTRLAIDAYGPISDNAKRIVKTADVEALDDAGDTIVAIGKGSAIVSAGMVSIALFGAFLSRAAISTVDVLSPPVVIGMIVGASLPYWFSRMTMKIVGSAGLKMFQEVHSQITPGLRSGQLDPSFDECIKIATDASIRGIVLPGALVMLTPLIVGTLFGVQMLSGVLAGSLGSVVWIAISASNNGGAWNKAEKYIMAGASEYVKTVDRKTLDTEVQSWLDTIVQRGDAIGDEQKDTSGPPLNILIQLIAVESLVFAPFFVTHGGLLFKIF